MEDRELTLRDLWNILWGRRKMIIRNALIAAVVVSIITLLLPNWYKATAVILPPENDNTFGAAGLLGNLGFGNILGGDQNQNRVLSILDSRTLLEALAKKYDFQERYGADNLEETIKELDDNIEVNLEEQFQITVSFWDTDQEMVAEMTNYILHCLDSLNIVFSTGKAHENRVFIEGRVNTILDSLKMLEHELSTFMEKEGILSLTDQVAVSVEKAAELKAQIMAKEIELTIAKNIFDKKNPKILQMENELAGYRSKYREFYRDNPDDKLMPNFNKVPELGIRFTRIQREINYYVKLLEFLGPQYEKAKIDEAKTIPTIQVLDYASRPEKKDKPRRSILVIVFTGITGVLSMYYAYFKDRFKLT